MTRLTILVTFLMFANASIILAQKTGDQPKAAGFGDFLNGHQFGAAASSLIASLGPLAFQIKGLFDLREKCEIHKKSGHCRTCTTTLYNDRRYGHSPNSASQRARVLGTFRGEVFKMGHGAHRCVVPESGKLGGKGLTSTFTWDDGRNHD